MTVAKSGRKVVIVGAKRLADIAYEFFTTDSDYEVAAFTVDAAYLDQRDLYGLPVVPFDEVVRRFPPDHYAMFIAISTSEMNRVRERMARRAQALGYTLASFVSSRAHLASTVKVGANCMVFPMCAVNTHAVLEDGVTLGTGVMIEHHARIGAYSFLSVNAIILGEAQIGERCFLGAGCIVADEVKVGAECILGAGTSVRHDVAPGKVLAAAIPIEKPYTSREYFERIASGR